MLKHKKTEKNRPQCQYKFEKMFLWSIMQWTIHEWNAECRVYITTLQLPFIALDMSHLLDHQFPKWSFKSIFPFIYMSEIWKRNLEKNYSNPLQYSCLENPMDRGAWWAAVHGVASNRTWLSDFPFTFHFHALEKEMATHSSVLAWRIPGTGEPGGLLPMGSHRAGHDWSDLAAAAAAGNLKSLN